ncbi:MAG: serine protease [Litorimonas sp.]
MRSLLLLLASSSFLFAETAMAQEAYFQLDGKLDAQELQDLQTALQGIELRLSGDTPAPLVDFKSFGKDLVVIDNQKAGSLPARIKASEIKIASSGYQPLLNTRIVGGKLARLGEHPWMVSLGLARYPAGAAHFCGGSLIADNWVLTAAHCVEDMGPGSIRLHAGSNDLQRGGQLRNVSKIIVHEDWNDRTNENDIALLHVSTPFDFNENHISATSYAESVTEHETQAPGGELLEVIGWGYTREGAGKSERLLRKVTVPVVRTQTCNRNYSGTVRDGMFCAGIGGKDSCQGDSGGPISTFGENRRQVGVVSWGYGCAKVNYPGVYARLADYSNWISEKMAE